MEDEIGVGITPGDQLAQADLRWMARTLELARSAEAEGEVPVGAVVVLDGECIGDGWNRPIAAHDPTAHAEMQALRAAAQNLRNYRLAGATLYVTLEPCAMCAGAIIQARLARVVFGTHDERAGAAGSVFNVLQSDKLNHRVQVTHGVLREECAAVLQSFFRARR